LISNSSFFSSDDWLTVLSKRLWENPLREISRKKRVKRKREWLIHFMCAEIDFSAK